MQLTRTLNNNKLNCNIISTLNLTEQIRLLIHSTLSLFKPNLLWHYITSSHALVSCSWPRYTITPPFLLNNLWKCIASALLIVFFNSTVKSPSLCIRTGHSGVIFRCSKTHMFSIPSKFKTWKWKSIVSFHTFWNTKVCKYFVHRTRICWSDTIWLPVCSFP